jgi:hypothetical protein
MNILYNSLKADIMKADIDLVTDTIKIALVTSSYTPNQDTHTKYSDITNEVANGNGYTTGGATLANKTVTQDDTDNEGVFDADDVTWANATITARGAVIYKDTGVASTSPLVQYIDFGSDATSTNSDFLIQFSSEGILNLN